MKTTRHAGHDWEDISDSTELPHFRAVIPGIGDPLILTFYGSRWHGKWDAIGLSTWIGETDSNHLDLAAAHLVHLCEIQLEAMAVALAGKPLPYHAV